MNSAIMELEEQDIELQLREIELKRKQLAIKREQLANKPVSEPKIVRDRKEYLHYSRYVKENVMRIADVCPDGSILIHHSGDSCTVSKKYSMRTLLWIKQKLPSWSSMQREESHFWRKLAAKYSRKFLKGDTISHTTMEKLCYLVDSGEADVWFEKYASMKGMGKQSTLDGA